MLDGKLVMYLLGLAAIAGGCHPAGEQAGPSEFDHAGLPTAELAAVAINEDPIVGRPYDLVIGGSTLWILDGVGEPFIHAVRTTDGSLIQSVGRKGDGPGEFHRSPASLSIQPGHPDAVWAFDLRLQRMTQIRPGEEPSGDSEMIELDAPVRVLAIDWLTEDRLFAQTAASDPRFIVFDRSGNAVHSVSEPLFGDPSVPLAERRKATQSSVAICSSGAGRVAMAYRTAGRIEFYDAQASLTGLAEAPFASEPEFIKAQEGAELRLDDSRSWYKDCTATGERIYALFSGRHRDRFPGFDERDSGRYIHVFDWTGAFLEVLTLDLPLSEIAVDEADTLLGSSVLTAKTYRLTDEELAKGRR